MRICLLFLFFFWTLSTHAQVQIGELCASNGDINYDPDFYNFSDWVELQNTSNSSIDVGGYYLSDDSNYPLKWRIPAGTTIDSRGYLIIWCDNLNTKLHSNFSFDADGETVVLSNRTGARIDAVTFPAQFLNMSYSKSSQGGSDWRISPHPTPGRENIHGPTGKRLDAPVFSKSSGRYSASVSIQLSHNQSNAEIRYTLDGSEPKSNSLKYSSPITLPATRVVKAAAFHPDFLTSETVTNTFLVREHTTSLPVVSISTNPSYLWDNTFGIYTNGTNGVSGNCNDNPMNWNRDWSRHAVFEYIGPNGNSLVNQSVDIRIGGACSRGAPQKSFVINPEKKFGSNTIQYSFFSEKRHVDQVGGLFLRNSGNDFNYTQFRDAFIQSLGIGKMDIDYMAYQPTVFYLNGEYWGIQNLREKIDGNFIESNYGIPKNDIDLLETYENAIEGSSAAWLAYKNTLQSLNPNDPKTFEFISDHIDVQEFINYLVTEIYVANTDWPGNNIKFWRQRSTNGKFRWILWDTDFGFGLYNSLSYSTHPTLNFATQTNGPGWPNPPWSTLHIRLLLQNPEFRKRFIATMATAMGTTFSPTRVNQVIDQFKSRIQGEIPFHKQRWGGNISGWENEIQRLRNFSVQRNSYMRTHVADFFSLGSPLNFSFKTLPARAGQVSLNGMLAEEFENAPYYTGIPYQIQIQPNAGFRFTGWTITTNESELINLTSAGSNWKYFDGGSLPSSGWSDAAFNDTSWKTGKAQLGYGDGDEATTVSFGSDSGNKYTTTYFRSEFTLVDLSNINDVSASVLFDDGVVVYLNGIEVFRNNMPSGSIGFGTLALQAVTDENAFVPFSVSKNLLKQGNNVWAVEVHQSSGGSSDISFDLQASVVRTGDSKTYESVETTLSGTTAADLSLVAHFEPIAPVEGLVLNEMSTTRSKAKDNMGEAEDWLELLNTSSKPINLVGLMITDDLTRKNKHVLLNDGNPWILQAGQYQLLWADDQVEQGREHLNFKLSAEGEEIGIYHIAGHDTAVIAEINYAPQVTGFSLARIPNGTGPFTITNFITPGEENQAMELSNSVIYPNPSSGYINALIQHQATTVTVFDLMGRVVGQHFYPESQVVRIELYGLPNGVYTVEVKWPEGVVKNRVIVNY